MRTIKFRILIKTTYGEGLGEKKMYYRDIEDLIENGFESNSGTQEIVARDEWTGLLDKNGKEIYENDIIKMDEESYGSPNSARVVTFSNGSFIEDIAWPASEVRNLCEVIGNTFENPNLLDTKSSST